MKRSTERYNALAKLEAWGESKRLATKSKTITPIPITPQSGENPCGGAWKITQYYRAISPNSRAVPAGR